jgi:Fe-S cluster assembly protein SufD
MSSTRASSRRKATGVFNGKVYVKQDAQRTRAYQSNANILQGDDARIFTKPELEIYADDVKCSHGCTIGRSMRRACSICVRVG